MSRLFYKIASDELCFVNICEQNFLFKLCQSQTFYEFICKSFLKSRS